MGVFLVFTSSDCDAEGDLRSSFECGDYAENCPKNRSSDMEIRGKQRKQVADGKPNISCKTRLLVSRELSWQEITNHITGCKAELISNEKYHSR